ncbi:MAG: hypothetical protein ACK2UU_16930, partial [Anaerolineae bacterium]
QGGQEIGEKTNWVVVTFVEGEPGSRPFRLPQPMCNQRRLSEPRWSRHQCQLVARTQTSIQLIDETRARDQIGPDGRNIQLCLQERLLLHDHAL